MAAREGKLHPTTRFELAANFGKIGAGVVDRRPGPTSGGADSGSPALSAAISMRGGLLRARPRRLSGDELGRLREGRSGHDLDPPSETCLGPLPRREPLPRETRRRESAADHRKEARNRTQLPAEGQLAEERPIGHSPLTCSDPTRIPRAIARSREAPLFRISAGARFTVIRFGGYS